ncbi:3-dehydroquinate dehydratase [Thermoplasma sp. Kam2015]|uniref:ABC transporter ATP-binding protein n=1 Tax=Thermoplasma sp. Kam2015 TaxID=2094122 RepID=UPI000D94159E|nr:ABC transporter ATP-binding protein [Thermoplasma sp. Kam2015]PYB69127.1 3-dehydroquinate dehydratase [Thermoplasma sp. Kam2015]
MTCSIKLDNISMRYGEKLALDDVSLEIPEGTIYGVLGPNGSGKTTMMKIILGLLKQTRGKANVCGYDSIKDPLEIKAISGYVPETPILYESMTPSELFSFIASIRRIDENTFRRRIDALIDAFGVSEYMNDFIGSLSFGNRQKIAIISAIMHDPKILIVDEGINGLDPRSAKLFKSILTDMRDHGKIIVFSTHILEIAESLCDHVAILYNGRIVANGTIEDLRSAANEPSQNLEEIFLKLTNAEDVPEVARYLRDEIEH